MSTATKLEYLNDTKGLLKDSINSLGGNITSQTTFRQYATELDSIYSRLPKVSGTGSILSLNPTLKGRLGSTLKGNTLQDGTPTPDSPVEIQCVTGLQKITISGGTGTTPQEYEINLGTIKLNKIGDYQDYITGTPYNWSIKRQIGSVVLNGTENYSDVSVRTNTIRCLYSLQGVNYTAKMTDLSFNNGIYNQDSVGQMLENNYLVLSYPIEVVGNTINSLKTWLSNNNSLIIYRLLEETTEPITNTELISQLNAFYNAKSYNGQTNISVEGDLQMILDVSALKGDE